MRIDLAFELHVAVLCRVCSFPLFLHVFLGCEGVIHDVDYAVDSDFREERNHQHEGEISLESGEDCEGKTEAYYDGFEARCNQCEYG